MTRVRWAAAKDGVAHASVGNRPRTMCGRLTVEDRFAWPATGRCLDCRVAIARREEVPTTQH